MPSINHGFHHRLCRRDVIETNDLLDANFRGIHNFNYRNIRHFEHFFSFFGMLTFRQNNAIYIIRQQAFNTSFFFLFTVTVMRQHGLITRFIGNLLNTTNHISEHLISQRRYQYTNCPTFSIGQDIRCAIRNIAETFNSFRNACLCTIRHRIRIA